MLYYVTSAAEVLLSEHGLDPGDPNVLTNGEMMAGIRSGSSFSLGLLQG